MFLMLPALFLQLSTSARAQNESGTAASEIKTTAEDLKEEAQNLRPGTNNPAREVSVEREIWSRDLIINAGLRLLRAFVIILIGSILYKLLTFGIRRLETKITNKDAVRESDATLRLKTLSGLVYWLGTVAISIGVLYIVLENFGFNVAPLLAGAGIVGLAFGFGGQYLIRDVINGIFILLEGQYHVGDVVKIGELSGLVEKVNLRVTQLRDLDGSVIFIPNGEITSVVNLTKEWSRAVFDIGVSYGSDVDRVMRVIKELGAEMRKDTHFGRYILDDLEMLGLDSFGESEIKIKFFIKTVPIKQWDVGREFRRRLIYRFEQEGIEMPYRTFTLYWGAGQEEGLRRLGDSSSSDEKSKKPPVVS